MTRLSPLPVLQPAPSAPEPATPSPVVGAAEPQYFLLPGKKIPIRYLRGGVSHIRLDWPSPCAWISQKMPPGELLCRDLLR
jgi:hypothetical protein